MLGRWVVTPLALVGQDGARVQTEPLPVLAVTQVQCTRKARNCTPNDAPRNIAMVGVGFGRQGDRQSQSRPDKNPLLRVTGGTGERRRGYGHPEGVHVATGANQGTPFTKLTRQQDRADCRRAGLHPLNGQMPPGGTMLMDTACRRCPTVPSGRRGRAAVVLPAPTCRSERTAESSSELYRFKVDGGSPLAPERIHLRVSPERVSSIPATTC